jgi:general secretion pathway protein D
MYNTGRNGKYCRGALVFVRCVKSEWRRLSAHVIVPLLLCLALSACQADQPIEEGAPPPQSAETTVVTEVDAPYPLTDSTTAETATPQPQSSSTVSGLNTEIVRGTGVFVQPTGVARVIDDGSQITLNFADADIREVVDTVLGQTLGLSYVVDENVQGTVTARTTQPLPRDKVLSTLESILSLHGAALRKIDGIYRVEMMDQANSRLARTIVTEPGSPLTPGYAVHIVPLSFASATSLVDTLRTFVTAGRNLAADADRNLLIFVGPSNEAQDLQQLVEVFDVDWMAGMSFGLFPLEFAQADSVVEELERIFALDSTGATAGVVDFLPLPRLNAVLAISQQARYVDQAQDWIRRLDRGIDTETRRIFVYFVQNGRAADLAAVLGELFSSQTTRIERTSSRGSIAPGLSPSLVESTGRARTSLTTETEEAISDDASSIATGAPDPSPGRYTRARAGGTGTGTGTDTAAISTFSGENDGIRIIADETRNAVIILATGAEYRSIEPVLQRLDTVPLQVLIEATIAEVLLVDDLEYGLQWFFSSGEHSFKLSDAANGAVASAFPGFSYVFDSTDARVVLNALNEISNVRVLSSPHLMVLDNEPARLQVGDQVPVPVQTSVSTIDENAPIVNSIEYRDTGVILDIIPRVNSSGLVTLDIIQEVSDVVETTPSGTGVDAPTIRQRAIQSTIAVRDGDTIALGGLIRDDTEEGSSGIPVLGDIPVVGNLFKTTTENAVRSELLILLTPRVIRNSNDAREVLNELRNRMSRLRELDEKLNY